MPERLFPDYGFKGEPETRVQREFENLYKGKLDLAMVKYFTAPNVTTVPEGKPILVKVGADWYTYINIDGVFYKQGPWVAV